MGLQFVPMRRVVQQGRLQLDQDLGEGEVKKKNEFHLT